MSLCIAASGKLLTLAATAFSLTWTHSVEKTVWAEHWAVEDNSLLLDHASVQGSGAGIGLPDNAAFRDGAWHYRPSLPPLKELNLAASGATASPWMLCAADTCLQLGAEPDEPVRIWPADSCDPGGGLPEDLRG